MPLAPIADHSIAYADNMTAQLSAIRCPAHVMHGTDDGAIASNGNQRVVELLPGASALELVGGGAHVLSLSHPALVTARVRGFIDHARERRP